MTRAALAILLLEAVASAQWPDPGGYRWMDSDTSAGPVFQWQDITSTGTRLTLGDDDNAGPFALGSAFTFYWRDLDSVRICSNGWLSFTSSSHQFHHNPIPDARDPNALVAPLWADLDPAQGGAVYCLEDTVQRRFVVSWVNVPLHGTSETCTFQAILDYASGDILLQYLSLPQAIRAGVDSCSVGIEDDSGLVGSEYFRDAAPPANRLHDSLAIRFYQLDYDACPVSVLRPMRDCLAGDTVVPRVHVWNAGVMPATFPVTLRLGDSYQRQVTMTGLPPLVDTVLCFPFWVPTEDTHPVVAFTAQPGDEFPANDTVAALTVGSYVGQVCYDDGEPDTWFMRNGAPTSDWAAAVRFTSPYGRFRLLGGLVHVLDSQPFARVLVCPDSNGTPGLGSPYAAAESIRAPGPGQWLELNADTVITAREDLWLVAFWPRSATGPRIGEDRDDPLSGRSWFGSPTVRWFPYPQGNLLMRLKVDGRSGIAEQGTSGLSLTGARPNPFRRSTVIHCARAEKLAIHDATGRQVRELPLVNGTMVWDGRDRAGLALPAGAYFARTTASDVPQVLRVVKTQ